jgi:small subunit ribosomal protein S14
MAKNSAMINNRKKAKQIAQYANKRAQLKAITMNRDLPLEERMQAQFKLSELPRNSSKTRFRNRCEVTGRPRGYYRKFRMCRNMLREMGNFGQIPGLIKSSW